MTALHTLILDFDGVVIESNDLKTRAFEMVFGQWPDYAQTMMAYHYAHVSESRFSKFRHFVTTCLNRQDDDPLVDDLGRQFSAQMLSQIENCPLVPGAQEFLDGVLTRGVPMYLASVTPQAELDAILDLRGFSRYFNRVYGCPPWTKASAISDILESGGRAGSLFIGDSVEDQRAAFATHVEFLARDSGLPFDDPQPPSVRDLHELLARITQRLPG